MHCGERGQHNQSPGGAKEHSEPQEGKMCLERTGQGEAWYEIRGSAGQNQAAQKVMVGIWPSSPKPQAMKRKPGRVRRSYLVRLPQSLGRRD